MNREIVMSRGREVEGAEGREVVKSRDREVVGPQPRDDRSRSLPQGNNHERFNRPHRRLDVWKKGMELVRAVYKATSRFPDSEKFGLVSQMRRAAVSIVANVAEGAARKSRKEFLQFISIAQGSLSELEAEIEISAMLELLSEEDFLKQTADVGKLLRGLANYLANGSRSS